MKQNLVEMSLFVVVTICAFLSGIAVAKESRVAFEEGPASFVQLEDLPRDLGTDELSRKIRQAPSPPAPAPTPDPKDLNLAPDVSEDYPVVFSIILFLSIILVLALIAISVAISTMDPGRDSLIYRVTSAQRFKKDN